LFCAAPITLFRGENTACICAGCAIAYDAAALLEF
jgi:hypothetical protein